MTEKTDLVECSLASSSSDSVTQEAETKTNNDENSATISLAEEKTDTLLLALLRYCSSRIQDISTLAGRPLTLNEFVVIIISTGVIPEEEFDFDIITDIDDYYNYLLKTVAEMFPSNISNFCNRWTHHIASLKMLEICLTHFMHDYHHLECKYEAGVKIKGNLKNYVCCTKLNSYICTSILNSLDKLLKKSVFEITEKCLSFEQFKFYNALCITFIIENLRSSKSDYLNSTKYEMKQAELDKCHRSIRIPNNLLEEVLHLITPVREDVPLCENEQKETSERKNQTKLVQSKIKSKISSNLRRKLIRKEKRKSEKLAILMKKVVYEQKQKHVSKNHEMNNVESEIKSRNETKDCENNDEINNPEKVSSENKDKREKAQLDEIESSAFQKLHVASNTLPENEVEIGCNNEENHMTHKNEEVTVIESDTNSNTNNQKKVNDASNEVQSIELLVNKVKQKIIFNILISKLSECANNEREPKNHITRRK